MTPEQRDAVLDSIAEGVDLDRAVRAAGMSRRRWDERVREHADLARMVADAEERNRRRIAAVEEERRREDAERARVEAAPVVDTGAARFAGAIAASEEKTRAEREADTAPPDEPSAGPLNLAAITREAGAHAPGPFGFFLWTNARRVTAGLPPISPWWLAKIRELYESGKILGVFNVGRGGGKSTTLETVAADRTLFAPRSSPPGQTWTWPFISVGPDDANRRIDGIAEVYRSVGLPIAGDYTPDGEKIRDGIEIRRAPRAQADLVDARGNPIQLASVAGTIGNVSGPSTVGLTIDEAAKLHDRSTNANPLREILTSAIYTSRGRAGWIGIVCSSAWTRQGAHWALVEQGDNETNYVARIGAAFLEEARAGFERVAAWEQLRGDPEAARRIREHATSLSPSSPLVPTWIANPTFGNPAGPIAWDGAALATRMLIQALPESALEGLSRVDLWLRECGSVPLDRDAKIVAPFTVEDARALGAFAAETREGPRRSPLTPGGLLRVHGYDDFGNRAGPQRRRGL